MAGKNKNKNIKKRANLLEEGGFSKLIGGVPDLMGGLASAGSAIAGMASNAQVGDTSSIKQQIAQQRSMVPSATSNEALMSEWSSYRPMAHVSRADVGGKNAGQIAGGALQTGLSGASAGMALGGPVGAAIGAGVGLWGGVISGVFGSNKAKREQRRLNKQVDEANNINKASFDNRIDSINQQQGLTMMGNYFEDGGVLHSGGAEFPSGLSVVGSGGTHEENPLGGVQIGMDSFGTPNMVEEGEVLFENYVFSNSLKADKTALDMVNLSESFIGKTFADIAKTLGKESKERPNDPISKRGLFDSMAKLTLAQEEYKQRNTPDDEELTQRANTFRTGGPMSAFDLAVGNYSTMSNPQVFQPTAASGRQPVLNTVPTAPAPMFRDIPGVSSPGASYLDAPMASAPGVDIIPRYESPIAKGSPAGSSRIYGDDIDNSQYLRYAPVLGSALSVIGDITGMQNRRDYTHANSIRSNDVSVNPLGNYMAYTPLDRNYYSNQLRSAGAASRSAIANQSGGNRATAMAGILASDQNMMGQLGALNRQAEEYNLNQRMQVEDFNRATNMFNSEQALRADMFNSESQFRASQARASMRQQIDGEISQARSANLSTLFDNLGDVGREAYMRNVINTSPAWLYGTEATGQQTYRGRKNGGKLMTGF